MNLFDSELRVQNNIAVNPGTRWFLLDLDFARSKHPVLLASACKALLKQQTSGQISYTVEGVDETPAVMLLESAQAPASVTLDGNSQTKFEYSAKDKLLWIHFENKAAPRELVVRY